MCPGTRKRTSGSEQRQSTQDTIWRTGPGLELGQTHAGMYCQVVKLWLWLNMVFLLNSAAVNSFCLRAMAMAGLFWLSAGLLFLLPHGLCKKVQVPQTRRQGDAKPLDPLEKLHSSHRHVGLFSPVYWDATLRRQKPCDKRPVVKWQWGIKAEEFPCGEPKKLLISEEFNTGEVEEYANEDTVVLIVFYPPSF